MKERRRWSRSFFSQSYHKGGSKMTIYSQTYHSPIGELILLSDGKALTGVHYHRSEFEKKRRDQPILEEKLSLFSEVSHWLDMYFQGENPEITFSLEPKGTCFQQSVWQEIRQIPYGQTTTYGEISQKIAQSMGKDNMSAQAIGGAVGSNPISIIIPCHRVIGKTGSITGYGGGIERKLALFALENIPEKTYFIPKNIKEARSFANYN